MEHAKVYKIINDVSDKIYVGSSTYYRLCERMNIHRQQSKDTTGRRNSKLYLYMREIGVEHFKIELIEKCDCKTKEELKPELNMFRANSDPDPTNYFKKYHETHREERNKKSNENYHANKEYYLEKQKEYREENKEEISKRRKEYREENKDKISEQRKKTITCECGAILTKCHLLRHLKTKSHLSLVEDKSV